jgi:hypothetical protein
MAMGEQLIYKGLVLGCLHQLMFCFDLEVSHVCILPVG